MSDNKEYDSLRERVEYLSGENAKHYQALSRDGIGINNDGIKDMRFEMLIDHLLGGADESVDRLKFEEKFHENLGKVLQRTLVEARKQRNIKKLHIPGQPPNGQPGGQQ